MSLCPPCFLQGFCRRMRVCLVDDAKISNPEYIRDLRGFCYALRINDEEWHEFVSDLYRDYRGWVLGPGGREIFLDMEEFERPSIREWFRDFCCRAVPVHVVPHVRCEAKERVRILATIMSFTFPQAAMFWGLRADNDNDPA